MGLKEIMNSIFGKSDEKLMKECISLRTEISALECKLVQVITERDMLETDCANKTAEIIRLNAKLAK